MSPYTIGFPHQPTLLIITLSFLPVVGRPSCLWLAEGLLSSTLLFRPGSHAFRTLDQRILGIVTQARTGHGYFGEYYQTHNIQEPADCPCGAGLQTHEHIVFKCRMHKKHADIIDKGAPDHQLATPFGTKTGIEALPNSSDKSKAFQKTRAKEIP